MIVSGMNCIARFTVIEDKNTFCNALEKLGCSYKVEYDESIPFPEWIVKFDSIEFSDCVFFEILEDCEE